MAQEDLANVWMLLQERIDVGHIMAEIIGHFTLSSLGRLPSTTHSFGVFVWIKVIFVSYLFPWDSLPIFSVPGVMIYETFSGVELALT
jgi:hypothetical protein